MRFAYSVVRHPRAALSDSGKINVFLDSKMPPVGYCSQHGTVLEYQLRKCFGWFEKTALKIAIKKML